MSSVDAILKHCAPVHEIRDLEPLVDSIRDARVVLLGEASHGTHEFYEWRRILTEWLIVKHGFRFVAVEGDWPPCQVLNSAIHSQSGQSIREALEAFHRWPTWMWANTEIIRLGEWLRTHNLRQPAGLQVGFHGLDVYSLFESIDEILAKLEVLNPFLARMARHRYSCFDPFKRDERSYARSLIDFPEGCEQQVVETLQDLLKTRMETTISFDIQQNARIVRNAEEYYRTMIHGNEDSWNIRDRHMMETLQQLLGQYGPEAKGIVWAHNSHIGDYRATDMDLMGQVNLGGLVREQLGEAEVRLIGFSTHQGNVIASHAWDGAIETMEVPPARPGSYDDLLNGAANRLGCGQFVVHLGRQVNSGPLVEVRGQRAIGVVYDPAHERLGNYVPTALARRYDALIFLSRTRALEPLIIGFDQREIPETWPAGK